MNPFRNLSLEQPCRVWTYTHACETLDSIEGNERAIKVLRSYLNTGNIPNIILNGPQGSGKTSAAMSLAKEYLGTYMDIGCLTINGAINRGKDVVSEKSDQKKGNERSFSGHNIINFIKRRLSLPAGMCKVVIIYDFDHMTKEAQMALRRVMETYSTRARFVLLVNSIDAVIEAIQSRCVIIRFNSLTDAELTRLLSKIASSEGVDIPQEIIDLLVIHADGDARIAINNMQVMSRAPDMTVETFSGIFNLPSFRLTGDLLTKCIECDSNGAFKIARDLIADGHQISDIVSLLFKILNFRQMKESTRVEYCKSISKCYTQSILSSTEINFFLMISEFIQISRIEKYSGS